MVYDGPLPVTLLSFTGQPIGETEILLQWATGSELNSDRFEIWQSRNGEDFELAAVQSSQGDSHTLQTYNQVVRTTEKENYFRLRQVDVDGHSSESDIISVSLQAGHVVQVRYFDLYGQEVDIDQMPPGYYVKEEHQGGTIKHSIFFYSGYSLSGQF